MTQRTGGVYVANQASNSVSVINNFTNSIVKEIPVGRNPTAIAYDAVNDNIYVANKGSNTVSVIDGTTNMVLTNITVGSEPLGIAINRLNNMIYVTYSNSSTVSIINGITNRVGGTVPLETPPEKVAVSSNLDKIYVTTAINNHISLIDRSHIASHDSITVALEVNPVNSGYISCITYNGNKLTNMTNGSHIMYEIGKQEYL